MKFFIVPLVLAAISSSAIADERSLAMICKKPNNIASSQVGKVTDINTDNVGNINYKISENDKWYYLKGNTDVITQIQYDFLKLAFITESTMSFCVSNEGKTLALELTQNIIKK
ncbi:hypothetical protein [Xenorhabdus nematophila]|nr:hypothetical protein [Xenorhabdus nematophila]CEK25561.1 conserved exported protein of unknown function [Xenorhabdus nematophila AN6/1]